MLVKSFRYTLERDWGGISEDEYDEEYEEESNNKTFLEQILTFGEDFQDRVRIAREILET